MNDGVESLAQELFGDRRTLASRYQELLAGSGLEWGLIGPREVPILLERHLINCALAARLVPVGASVLDIGSGAGLPGLVWAIARPDLQITLVEPLLRRATWLENARSVLQVPVGVVRARAEDLPRIFPDLVPAQVVTARAVAPLATLLGWTAPLMAADGMILALKGSSAAAELERDASALRRLKLVARVETCADPRVAEPTRVILARRRPRQRRANSRPGVTS